MFVAKIPNRTSPPCYLLRESRRVDGKVKTTTLANLSSLSQNQIAAIAAALKDEDLASVSSLFQIDRNLPHGHVAAIIGTLRKIGIDRLIAPDDSPNRSLALGMIALKIMAPDSKLAMSRMLSAETATSSLSQVLGIETISANDFPSLLKDLATLTLNTVTTAKDATFTMLARPTKLHTKAFDGDDRLPVRGELAEV